MSKRKIPDTVINSDVRSYLNELATHIDTLEKYHKELCDLGQNSSLNEEQKALLKVIIQARNNLDSQWRQLTPTIEEAIATGKFVITNK